MTHILVQNLNKSFNDKKVLSNLNLEIEANKSLVILGGSGSGKSVLIKNIVGLMRPDSGQIIVDNHELNYTDDKQLKNFMTSCGFLFQGGALFDSFNIADNISFYAKNKFNLNSNEAKDLAADKLIAVGLKTDILDLYPAELSGGMQKRVALARAIAHEPKIIFFDEPTTGLDPIMCNVINELIVKVKKDLGATTVTITHDINSAKHIADNIAMLYKGQIIWHDKITKLENSNNEFVDQFVSGKLAGPIIF